MRKILILIVLFLYSCSGGGKSSKPVEKYVWILQDPSFLDQEIRSQEMCEAAARYLDPDNPPSCLKVLASQKDKEEFIYDNDSSSEYWELVVYASRHHPFGYGVLDTFSSASACSQALANFNRQYKYAGGTCYPRY